MFQSVVQVVFSCRRPGWRPDQLSARCPRLGAVKQVCAELSDRSPRFFRSAPLSGPSEPGAGRASFWLPNDSTSTGTPPACPDPKLTGAQPPGPEPAMASETTRRLLRAHIPLKAHGHETVLCTTAARILPPGALTSSAISQGKGPTRGGAAPCTIEVLPGGASVHPAITIFGSAAAEARRYSCGRGPVQVVGSTGRDGSPLTGSSSSASRGVPAVRARPFT